MKRLIGICLLLVTFASHGAGFSETEWERVLMSQAEHVLAFYHALLGKNLSDAGLYLETELERNVAFARLSAARAAALEGLSKNLDADPTPLLREARLNGQAAYAIADHVGYLGWLHQRLVAVRKTHCDADSVARLVKDFAMSGTPEIKRMMGEIQKQITEVQKKGVEGFSAFSFNVHVAIDHQGGGSPVSVSTPVPAAGGDPRATIVSITTAVGSAIGAMFFGIGSVLGAAIGAIIGWIVSVLFCGIFFTDPSVKLIQELRAQSQAIVSAIDSLQKKGFSEAAMRYCKTFGLDPTAAKLARDIEARWPSLVAEVDASVATVVESNRRLDRKYAEQLKRIHEEVLPYVETWINKRFDACFAEIKTRSAESRRYAGDKLPEPLRVLLDDKAGARARFLAEEQLWSRLLEGEVRYSAGPAFTFQPEFASQARELVAWDGVARAIYQRLNRALPGEALPGGKP